ncbi:hypothetical protein F5884DRAFT_107989 [Xylogone sp. PMI_703]|nr:hypothetical protein F5884DRAFT_107989 [Xylogone sp. PMI_703]
MNKQPATRLRRSCEACRASRTRCCPSAQDPRQCQRCIATHRNCVFHQVRSRQKIVKATGARVEEMEKRLDNIIALLSSPGVIFSTKGPNPQSPAQFSPQDLSNISQPHSEVENEELLEVSSTPSDFDQFPDVICKGIISSETAANYLESYRAHVFNFPFLVIGPQETLGSMKQYRPLLLLSVLTVSAKLNSKHQKSLESELRRTLSRKVIVNGEKSLDILQGLLVYLCWYHYYFNPERQQLYQLYKLAIAMAEDLRITEYNVSLDGLAENHQGRHLPYLSSEEIEAKRTFLGVYYLSSCLSLIFKRRNALNYTPYVEDCCKVLSEANQAPYDYQLQYYIQLQRLTEEITCAFGYDNSQRVPFLDPVRIELLVRVFNNQLKQLEALLPLDTQNNVVLKLLCLTAHIYINEIGFHAAQSNCPVLGVATHHDWISSIQRSETLQQALNAAKKFLDEYLVLPVDELRRQTIMEESNLVYAISILGKFTSGVWTPNIEAIYFREAANFNYYMETLIAQLEWLVTSAENGCEQVDFFWHFRRIFQHTKKLYEPQISGEYFTTLDRSGLPDVCIDLSFNKILHLDVNPKTASEEEMSDQTDQTSASVSQDGEWALDIPENWLSLPIDHDALPDYN